MIQRIYQSMYGGIMLLLLGLIIVIAQAVPTSAQNLEQSTECGSNVNLQSFDTTTEAGREAQRRACGVSGNTSRIEGVIKTVINVLSAVVGAVSIIMIIIGGFKYITSSGDSNNVSSAKNTILYAIVGLVIVAFAQVIVQFVLERT